MIFLTYYIFSTSFITMGNSQSILRNAVLLLLMPDNLGNLRLQMTVERRGQNGTYGLPGGRIERGEDPFDAAIREFKQETGEPLEHNHLDEKTMAKITVGDTRFHIAFYDKQCKNKKFSYEQNREISEILFPRLSSLIAVLSSGNHTTTLKCGKRNLRLRRCMYDALSNEAIVQALKLLLLAYNM